MNYYKMVVLSGDSDWTYNELLNGRARFGWSFFDCDLRKIQKMKNSEITDNQRLSWRMSQFLIKRVRVGDRLVIQIDQPMQSFYIAEVVNDYEFDKNERDDFNHILPVKLLNKEAIKITSNIVSNNMRNDLSKRGHYYCIYPQKTINELDEIVNNKLWNSANLKEGTSFDHELNKTHKLIKKKCINLISNTWKSKHFEEFIYNLISVIPNINVKSVVDSGLGWDLLIQIEDPISGVILKDDVPVQCKNYQGEVTTTQAVSDLVRSIENSNSDLAYLVIMGDLTDEFMHAFTSARDKLKSGNDNVDFILIDQDQVADLYMKYKHLM